ncbi:MAG: hypothetical protein ABSG03_41080 [Bryobacteraceae bacterium]
MTSSNSSWPIFVVLSALTGWVSRPLEKVRNDYVDPATCATCHAEIAKEYLQTGMGRSFYRPNPQTTIEDFTSHNTLYHKAGSISFVQHMIMDDLSTKNAGGVTFTEPHGATFADVDGDGVPDFIVGKRYWSHLDDYYDADAHGPPLLYWYRDGSESEGARGEPNLFRS